MDQAWEGVGMASEAAVESYPPSEATELDMGFLGSVPAQALVQIQVDPLRPAALNTG